MHVPNVHYIFFNYDTSSQSATEFPIHPADATATQSLVGSVKTIEVVSHGREELLNISEERRFHSIKD